MSEDDQGKPYDAPTPREGTPSFDELDASMKEVPLVGPTPDHASEYVGPRTLPRVSDHRTMEIETVKVREQEDPRRAHTVKNLRTLQREADPARATADSTEPAVTDSAEPAVAPAKPTQPRESKRGLVLLAVAVGVLSMLVIVFMMGRSTPPPEPTLGKVDLAAPPQPVPTMLALTTAQPLPAAPPASVSAAVSAEPPASASSAAPAPAAPAPKLAPKSSKGTELSTQRPEAKPIFDTEPKTKPKPAAKPVPGPSPLFE
ncbi:MAG: hypothetical protein R3B13_15530 [Polyangiaceae bacterium]